MSSFSKKYYAPKDPEKFLGVTWETGYKNIVITYNDRIVHVINQPATLMEGIKFEDEELGKIKIQFTTERPRKLEIKVNRKKYKTVNKIDLGYDYTGLVTVFTSLSVFALIGVLFLLGMVEFNIEHPVVKAILMIDILIIIAYGVTSYLLHKKKPMAYFIGASIFLFTTFYETFIESILWSDRVSFIYLIFRYSILIFILVQVRHILNEVNKGQKKSGDNELLDET